MKINEVFEKIIGKKSNSETKKERFEDLAYEVSSMVQEARIAKGITQGQLAIKMKTKQPGIARAEAGLSLPSLSFLFEMAEALKTQLIPPQFAFLTDHKVETQAEQKIEATNANVETPSYRLNNMDNSLLWAVVAQSNDYSSNLYK